VVTAAGLALAIGSATSLAAEAGAGAAKTTRVSISSKGQQATQDSIMPSISANGRFIAFASRAGNLVRRDSHGMFNVFVHDRRTDITRLVSVNSAGEPGSGRGSLYPAISADGRVVAFQSTATNLVSGDTNERGDVFVHDRATGETERVSVSSSGAQANRESSVPAISADGRFVAFVSKARLASDDTTGSFDVYVHDRETGETTRLGWTDCDCGPPSISASGRFVAFHSSAKLVPDDTRRLKDVFVHDRETGETTRVSIGPDGRQANRKSGFPSISASGRFVAFRSTALNLVDGDANGVDDIFVHDRLTAETTRVSVSSAGAQSNGRTKQPSISASGRLVTFWSRATNLVRGDTNEDADVFVHDRQTGRTRRVSLSSSGAQAHRTSRPPTISADGRFVAFASPAGNLVRGDSNRALDVFVRGPLR
jgi:Tol biopolymer transport system component